MVPDRCPDDPALYPRRSVLSTYGGVIQSFPAILSWFVVVD